MEINYFFFTFLFLSYNFPSLSDDKILSSPLINLEELEPSFEEVDEVKEDIKNKDLIKNKKVKIKKTTSTNAKFIGLDKITAKTSEIIINLGETKKFGPLEIKVLKCKNIISGNKNNNVAYLQVKDLTKNDNEKVFSFNGWTFSSDPNVAPFDHAIYDLQLVNCNNV